MSKGSSASWTEVERLRILRDYSILDTPPEPVFDEIVALAAEVCDTPIALVSLVDELRQWFKAEYGLGQRETPRAVAVCAHAMLEPDTFIVPDLSRDTRFTDNPLVTGAENLRFYAGVQLIGRDGVPLGTLSVLDRCPRPEGLSPRQQRLLRGLARQVMSELELRRSLAEQRIQLQRFQLLFEQAPLFLALCEGPALQFGYANRAFHDLIGRETVFGHAAEEALRDLNDDDLLVHLRSVWDSGAPFRGRDLPLRRKKSSAGSSCRHVDMIVEPMVGANGRIVGLLCAGSDMTEEHQAKDQAARLRAQIEHGRQVSAMGLMATTIAHELNQPLAAAGNYLSAVRYLLPSLAGDKLAKVAEAAALADDQLARAGQIIRSARTLVTSGLVKRELVEFADLVARVRALLAASGECPGLSIRTELAPVRSTVCVDRIQIEQVLLNLIRNAYQANRSGSECLVMVTAHAVDADCVEVTVRDYGPGIPEEAFGMLFTTLHQSTSGGLGAGLSICATIVRAHGGRIWAVNEPDGGASFHFTLAQADDLSDAA
ncbi:ATP-binding protein [Sphingosinicella sp. BN140058]|uniref:ATP-binding protein n=1 Tax=Sphingosinicella sp. BN140058 TaxID=1892855 RepID=UPI0013EBDEDD|nr:ATP-binding protein [Sphingosinicella sp. BN140058]